MAEEESDLELDTFKKELDSLLRSSASDERGLQSKTYCERFCELVVEQTGRWQVPLPQLQVLRSALCSFVQSVESFPPECEHVRYTLSSLALSVFELLLFFGKDEFVEHPLKDILDSFQDCYTSLVRHQNVYLLQVRHIIKDGGPWANPVLQAILKNSELPQEDADRYLSSEVSIFFELRVRYLVACERLPEAIALAKRCSQHSVVGRHLYFMQAYLTCLWRASFHECFYKEMANIDGKDAVEILCMMENEEKDDMVLTLSKGFLCQQLQNGDMYYLWDLVFIWSKLYLRVNRFKQGFLEECKQMILSVTNTKAVFPFMKVILEELGKDGLGFCVELCARALQSDLKNDPVTKSILYKTIANLLPNDIEFCRACALLVFFLERTVESYRTVFLLYAHPDQEYHADNSPVVNNVRYEVLQILKKELLFDPEFWSLLNIEMHCLRLMSDKVAKAALCDIIQKDKWAQSFCMKGFCHCHNEDTVAHVDKPTNRDDQEVELVETLVTPASGETSSKPPGKRRGRKPGSKLVKYPDPCPVRQSLRQIDVAKNHTRQLNSRLQRFLARQAEGTTRRGRRPQWLLEELAAQAENSVPQEGKRRGRKPKQSDISKEILVDAPVYETPLKLSFPDNEVNLSSETEASLFSTETSQVTESNTDKTKTAHQEVSKWPTNSSSSLLKLLSVETSACKKKDYRVREEPVFTEQVLSIIQKFHTYSKVTEIEEITVGILPRDQEVKPDANEFKEERLVQSAEGTTQVISVVETDATQIPAIHFENTPVEAASGPTEKLNVEPNALSLHTMNTKCPVNTVIPPENVNVDHPLEAQSCTAADTIPVPGSMLENTTTENMTTEDAPAVLTEVTSVPDEGATLSQTEVPDSSEIVQKDTTMSELPAGPQSPAEVLQDTHTDVDNHLPDLISTSVGSERLSTKCSLCNKETKYQYILRHAMWHYRTDRKCMFCHKRYTHGRSPSVHFKLHIQELKKSNGRFKENICKSVTELPETAKQKLLKRMNRTAQNKFRNIKMRLNSSLNIADLHKERHGSQSQVRLRTRLAKNSEPANTLEEEEEEEKVCKKKRRLRRVLARKSQSTDENKKFRMRLARKRAKNMQAPEEEDSNTTGNSTNRLNGLIRKRKVRKVKKEEDASDEKTQTLLTEDRSQQKIEFIEHADKNALADVVKTESQNVELTNLDRTSIIESEMRVNDSKMQNSTKTLPQADHKKDVVAVKKRKISPKVVSEKQEHKENASAAKEINTIGQNGTQTKPKQRSILFQGKRTGASTEVRCPVEVCTFSAKSILVLSHVLSHHHGDKKALVFFFNFGKEKCLFCSRKVCNAQHFFDHVMCHRGELKHPCYHHGCKERFQTRVELSDHMLGHHPLRAICCFPGCPMQVDSILHLYKHERTHYRLDTNLELTQDSTEPATNSSKGQLVHDTVKHKGPANQDDDVKHLVLNKGHVNYSSKNSSLINGHGENDKEVPDKPNTPTKKQEPPVSGKPATKQFIRPPPSAYLDESYISMPKRWKEPQVGSNLLGAVSSGVTNTNRQRCSRCFESFSSEEELQTHKDKCTSLFGFDSDDESAT